MSEQRRYNVAATSWRCSDVVTTLCVCWEGAFNVGDLITKTRLFKYIENLASKNWKFSDKKNSDIFHIAAQNIDCGYSLEPPRRGGSNEYPQSMFLAKIRKIMYTPVNPFFYYIKVGFKGQNNIGMFSWCFLTQELRYFCSVYGIFKSSTIKLNSYTLLIGYYEQGNYDLLRSKAAVTTGILRMTRT